MKKQFKKKVRNRIKLFKHERILDYNVCETMFFGVTTREKTLTYIFPGEFAFWENIGQLTSRKGLSL
jgi:hypothetical protein